MGNESKRCKRKVLRQGDDEVDDKLVRNGPSHCEEFATAKSLGNHGTDTFT